METVGERLKKARLSRGLTQDDLAKSSGVPVVTISRIENDHGQVMPRITTVRKLTEVLAIEPGWLLYGEKEIGGDD